MYAITVIYKNRRIDTLMAVETKVRDKKIVRRVLVDSEYMSNTKKREISLIKCFK